ncbi:MAG: AmpG family muropeptide MFS transporter [Rhodospirillales bacterium]|nr:AmpG family muropeptide MFS transporter [Rhodospirillales bacterium]
MPNTVASDGWRGALAIYGNRRQLVIFLMGFSSGLPLLLGFSTLSYWLAKEGVALAAIGGLLTVSTPYSLKFLWAPALDHVRLPVFTRLLGRRRGWALFIQILLMGAIVALGASDPADNLVYMAAMALVVAFLSASQDIVIDAYRIEILEEDEQGAGAAMTQAGYRIGLLAAGAGALALADFISWFWVYGVMAALVSVGMIAVLIAPEPARVLPRDKTKVDLRLAVIEPFAEFFTRNGLKGTMVILAFVLLYKYGDAVAGAMANPFYHQIGFSGVEIASVTKALGVAATLVGVFAGGALVAKAGVLTALLIGGVLQALTNLIFAWLATVGADISVLAIAVGADSFTGGLGSAAFVAYLSGLCNVAFTGTQFALLTSMMALGRTVLAASSGFIAEQAGWAGFFIATTGLAVPGLLLLLWVSRLPAPDANRRSGFQSRS